MNFGTTVERVLARLPARLGKQFKRNTVHEDTFADDSSNLTFWFIYDRPPTNDFTIRAQLIGGGNELRHPIFASAPRNLPNGKTVAYSGTRLWPRRDKRFTVRLSAGRVRQESQYQKFGEITVSNPAYRKYPEWTPEPLPATRRFDNVTFILDELRDTREVRLRVTSPDKSESAWEAWGCYVRDATGNALPGHGFWHQPPLRARVNILREVRLPLIPFGMPREKAWKIGVHFVRTGLIDSNKVYVLRGVPAAATGPLRFGIWTTNLPSGVVQFQHQHDSNAKKPCLTIVQPNPSGNRRSMANPISALILGAVNDLGEKIEPIQQTKIHIPPGSTTLDITVAIPLQHFVEYIIDPEPLLDL